MKWEAQEIVRVTSDPENPSDGLIIYNSTGNVMKRWAAATNEWVIITDYNTMTADMGAIQKVTTDNDTFLGLLASAKYTVDGLELSGPGGVFKQLLGAAAQEFYQSGERTGGYWDNRYNAKTINAESEIQLGGAPIIVKTATGWMIP